jgi:ribosome biogenesis protein SSF1/2
MNLSSCKRVVLFNKTDKENEEIEFRHYGVSARQRALNRRIKKLVNKNKAPNLSGFNSIADYILKGKRDTGAYSSESELDDLPDSKITLPDDYQDKKKGTQVAVRLHELGPRVKLQLHKIEEGLFRGNVVYHSHQNKSSADVRKQLDGLKNKRELKDKRKKIQEENVAKKKKIADDKEGKWVKDDDSDDAEDGDKSKSSEKKVTKSDDFKKKSFSKSPSKSSDK